MTGKQVSSIGLQALRSINVNGPSTVPELDTFDPDNGGHKLIIKSLLMARCVTSDTETKLAGEPTRYSLTNKGRDLIQAKHDDPAPRKPKGKVAGPLVYGSMATSGQYNPCADMLAPATRPGADACLAIPSRVNDRLHYRDGRVVPITHQTMEQSHAV